MKLNGSLNLNAVPSQAIPRKQPEVRPEDQPVEQLDTLNLKLSQFSFGEITSIPYGIDFLNDRIFEGGKQFRPQLIFKVGRILGVPLSDLQTSAIAVERVHCATLLHDDVIDDSVERRGRPTLNAKGENRKAIIAGDFLLAKTLEDLAPNVSLEILNHLFKVLVDLSEGEWLQIEARGIMPASERHLREVCRKKTASLIGWCFATPGRLGHCNKEQIVALQSVGIYVGMAFQMLDDCLDFDSTTGKPFAQDLFEGQVNFLVSDLLEKHPHAIPAFRNFLGCRITKKELKEFQTELQDALKSTLLKAELEIIAAITLIKSSGLTEVQIDALIESILQPFQKRILEYRPIYEMETE